MNELILILLMGVITFIDFSILIWKWNHNRYLDFLTDLGSLVIILMFFHGSMAGMMVGMVAQVLMSLYLLVYPPRITILGYTIKK